MSRDFKNIKARYFFEGDVFIIELNYLEGAIVVRESLEFIGGRPGNPEHLEKHVSASKERLRERLEDLLYLHDKYAGTEYYSLNELKDGFK